MGDLGCDLTRRIHIVHDLLQPSLLSKTLVGFITNDFRVRIGMDAENLLDNVPLNLGDRDGVAKILWPLTSCAVAMIPRDDPMNRGQSRAEFARDFKALRSSNEPQAD